MFKWLEANNQWLMWVYAGVLFGIVFFGILSVVIAYLKDGRASLNDSALIPAELTPTIYYFDAMDSLCESIAGSPSAAMAHYTMLVCQLQEAGIEYPVAAQAARRLMREVFHHSMPEPQ